MSSRPPASVTTLPVRSRCAVCKATADVHPDPDGVHRCPACSYQAFRHRRPQFNPADPTPTGEVRPSRAPISRLEAMYGVMIRDVALAGDRLPIDVSPAERDLVIAAAAVHSVSDALSRMTSADRHAACHWLRARASMRVLADPEAGR